MCAMKSKNGFGSAAPAVPEPVVELSEHDLAYRERAKKEAERKKLATDSEFWLALCFKSDDELEKYRQKTGFGSLHELVPYPSIKGKVSAYKPRQASRGGFKATTRGAFAKAVKPTNTPDPLADVQYTGDLEEDCKREFSALLAAMQSVRTPQPLAEITDSEYWYCIVFESRESKDQFLESYALSGIGDKYVDGRKILDTIFK